MVRMIGAMPALAVRQQRKHIKPRPSTLTIDTGIPAGGLSSPLKSPRPSPRNSPAPSLKSSPKTPPKLPQGKGGIQPTKKKGKKPSSGWASGGYICGKFSFLHVSVVCILVGITLLVVGLVQLAPGTGDPFASSGLQMNKYALIGCGCGFLGIGFLLLILLCLCQRNAEKSRRTGKRTKAAKTVPSASTSKVNLKSSLKNPSKQTQLPTIDGALVSADGILKQPCHSPVEGRNVCHFQDVRRGCHSPVDSRGPCHSTQIRNPCHPADPRCTNKR